MTDELPPLPEPDLECGTKMVPYEERFFYSSGMAHRLGYTNDTKHFYRLETVTQYALLATQQLREEVAELKSILGEIKYDICCAHCLDLELFDRIDAALKEE